MKIEMKWIITTAMLISVCFVQADNALSRDLAEKIVAKVDYGVITMTDLVEASRPSIQQIRESFPPEEWDQRIREVQQRILMQMINEYVCVRFARENEILVTDEEVESALKSIRDQAGITDDKVFRQELAKEGLTIDEMRDNLKRQAFVRKVLRREVQGKVRVTDSDIRNYWKENADQFATSEKIRVAVLMLDSESWGLSGSGMLRSKADQIYEKLQAGEDFAILVKEYSDGPAKEDGGDIGFLEKGKALPVIEEAAFKMETGEFSKPLETDFGFVIVKVIEKQEAGTKSIDDVRDEIEMVIRRQKTRDLETEFFEKQRAKTFIQMMEF